MPGREAMRPPRRAQESQCHTMKIIGKSMVFACPGRWNAVHSAASLCAAWEILWLLEILGKPLEKQAFCMCGRNISNGYVWCDPCAVQKNWNGPCRGRRRKSVNLSATTSGNDVRNSGRSARPRPPPTPLSWQNASPK